MMSLISILLTAWLLALLATPLVMRLARHQGLVDRPSGRKQHAQPTPLLGGLAVFGSAALALGLLVPFSESVRLALFGGGSLISLGAGVSMMVALGIYDDKWDIPAPVKLAVQVWIAIVAWVMGFRAGVVALPFGFELVDAPLVSLIVTVLWITVITNAFNLIDGLDGLAAGIALIATLSVFLLASTAHATVPVVAALALAGSLAGFLRYNIPPARIFLGDAGSMAIGYTVAVLSLGSYQKGPTAAALVVPLFVIGVPLLDTVLAIVRRLISHLSTHGWRDLELKGVIRSLFRADRGHIHHLLMRSGWSVRRVLFSLYAISGALCGFALWSQQASTELRWSVFMGLVILSLLGLQFLERQVTRKEQAAQHQAALLDATPDRREQTG